MFKPKLNIEYEVLYEIIYYHETIKHKKINGIYSTSSMGVCEKSAIPK